jgi:nucleoid DNA-binding protein
MKLPIHDQTEKKGLQSIDVMDYPTIVEKLADQQKLSEVKVRAIVRDFVALMAEGLKNGKAVRIGGLGLLRIRNAKAAAGSTAAGESQTPKKRVVLSSSKKFNIAIDLDLEG